MYRTLEQQLQQLQTGLDFLANGGDFQQWDCNATGDNDCGVDGFPFCGGRGYQTIACPFDTRTVPGDKYRDGCFYHCNVMQLTPEQQVQKIINYLASCQERLGEQNGTQ